jgi:hypothetical protein
MNYKLYFELFGKKMVTTIQADSREEAELKLRSKIKIHKTEAVLPDLGPFGNIPDVLKDLFK